MSSPPKNFSYYSITQSSAFLQWFSTGADTNYADIMVYTSDYPSVVAFSSNNIYTPNTQYYSSQITGLQPRQTYKVFIRTKLAVDGTGLSSWVRAPDLITLPDINGTPSQQLVYVKTNIAGYFFDAFLQINYTKSVTATEHPVETGASITDHVYRNPAELVMQIGMSDVATSFIAGQFDGASRSVEAFKVLVSLQDQRLPVRVMTRLGTFDNMIVQTIAVPDDYTTVNGLKATVTLKEILIAKVKTVKISGRAQTTDSTKKGDVQPVKPNKSILKSLEDSFGPLIGGYTS